MIFSTPSAGTVLDLTSTSETPYADDANVDMEPTWWRTCTAVCANRAAIHRDCNVAFVDIDNAVCYSADVDLKLDLEPHAADQDRAQEIAFTQFRVGYLSVYDALHE